MIDLDPDYILSILYVPADENKQTNRQAVLPDTFGFAGIMQQIRV